MPAPAAASAISPSLPKACAAAAPSPSLIETPSKPSRPPQLARRDRAAEGRGAVRERGVGRKAQHHELAAGADEGAERRLIAPPQLATSKSVTRWLAKSVLVATIPIPGKCLAVAATPRRPEAGGEAADAGRDDPCRGLVPNERPSVEIAPPGRPTSSTGARSTLKPAGAQRPAGALALAARVAATAGAHLRGRRGRRPGHALDLPALLIDGDEQRRLGRIRRAEPLELVDPAPRRRAGADVVVEEDHAGDAAGADQPLEPGRRLGAVPARDQPLAGELAGGDAGDERRRPRPTRPALHRRRRSPRRRRRAAQSRRRRRPRRRAPATVIRRLLTIRARCARRRARPLLGVGSCAFRLSPDRRGP